MAQLSKVCIISDQHLCTNPRVWKEANCLAKNGFKVIILTVWVKDAYLRLDKKFIFQNNMEYKAPINLSSESSLIRKIVYKSVFRLINYAASIFKIESSLQLGYISSAMYKAAIKEQADIYICHREYGLLLADKLLAADKKVIVDLEDWYSEDYLIKTRPRYLLKNLEAKVLNSCNHIFFPSEAMWKAISSTYNIKTSGTVIYNSFPDVKNTEDMSKIPNSMVWFSQTIGPGRGLETLFESLNYVNIPVQLFLIGNEVEGYLDQLRAILNKNFNHSITHILSVTHDELMNMLPSYVVGLAIELNEPQNKSTTVSNKLFQYLQAKLKVLVTDTLGQLEVASAFKNVIRIVPQNQAKAWAQALLELLSDDLTWNEEQQTIYKESFRWEKQEVKMLNAVSKYV